MTAHIEAKKEDIAKTVIMPGDPLRAKWMAETFLEDYRLVNQVRGMLAYTGLYKGKQVTIMGHGMGIPSVGIYSYELFRFYDVEEIIRVGSCGAYTEDLQLYDVILVEQAYSDSNYAKVQSGYLENYNVSSNELNDKITKVALEKNIALHKGNIHCSDVFYKESNHYITWYQDYKCLAVEMESFGLFHNAIQLGKKATCLLTVSDHLITKEETTSTERQTAFKEMVVLALESIL